MFLPKYGCWISDVNYKMLCKSLLRYKSLSLNGLRWAGIMSLQENDSVPSVEFCQLPKKTSLTRLSSWNLYKGSL